MGSLDSLSLQLNKAYKLSDKHLDRFLKALTGVPCRSLCLSLWLRQDPSKLLAEFVYQNVQLETFHCSDMRVVSGWPIDDDPIQEIVKDNALFRGLRDHPRPQTK